MNCASKTPRDLYDDFIKQDWPALFREGGEVTVRRDDGVRYVPGQWANAVMKDDRNAWDIAMDAYAEPIGEDSTSGYDRIIEQAGPQYTWEGCLIDPARGPWASAVPANVRQNIEDALDRRVKGNAAAVAARAQVLKDQEDAEAETARDEEAARKARIRALHNENRRKAGLPPLTADQERLLDR